jgi:transposase-like protein
MPQLPPPNVKRWTAKRKAAVVVAVQKRVITVEEACRRYEVSEEEFFAWQRAFETYGVPGLRSTRIMQYRRRPRPPSRGRRR